MEGGRRLTEELRWQRYFMDAPLKSARSTFYAVFSRPPGPMAEWDRERGYRHYVVDLGRAGRSPWAASALLLPDGPFDRDRVLRSFLALAAELPPGLAGFVTAKLSGAEITAA